MKTEAAGLLMMTDALLHCLMLTSTRKYFRSSKDVMELSLTDLQQPLLRLT
jgi:hypothetical protein